MNQRTKQRAFSMVELVIVVVILGVIAAIAIPRITSGSQKASESALKADLTTLRNSIEWYYAEHGNVYPGVTSDGSNAPKSEGSFIGQLTMYTDKSGEVSSTSSATHIYGPYLRSFPGAPVGGNSGNATVNVVDAVAMPAVDEADTKGWIFCIQSGLISVNAAGSGIDGTNFSAY